MCHFEEGRSTILLEESFGINGPKTLVPGGSTAVQRAFYGDAQHLWDETYGQDVTNAVKAILDCGQPLQATNKVFGDPIPGTEKMLIVEAAIPACPVSFPKAMGFIEALRDEYLHDVESAVGKFLENPPMETIEPFEHVVLVSFEKMVRSSRNRDEAISHLAVRWGVQEK